MNRASRTVFFMLALIVLFFFISNAYETKIISLMSSKPRVHLVGSLQNILDFGTTMKAGRSPDMGEILVRRTINWDYESNQPRYTIMQERFAMVVSFYPIPARTAVRQHFLFVLKAFFESGILGRWRKKFILLSNPERYSLLNMYTL